MLSAVIERKALQLTLGLLEFCKDESLTTKILKCTDGWLKLGSVLII